jgi:hypothetical protein
VDHAAARVVHGQSPICRSLRRTVHPGNGLIMFNRSAAHEIPDSPRGPRPAPCPAPGDLVLLTDPGLVLEPDLYRLARRVALGDLVEALGEVFLNAAMASASWA